jgi:predicted nucleic acid-binding protein
LFSTIHTNQGIADKVVEIRKKYSIKLPDAIIAATALTNNLSLVTRNTDDFKSIDHLDIINPFD